jgi:hypothetical protein
VPYQKIIKFFENSIILAVSLSLFGGRWISYIGLPSYNIFVLDLIYFLGLIGIVIFQSDRLNPKRTFFITALLVMFIVFQISRNANFFLVTRLRDLVPYIYLLSSAVIINKFSTEAWIRAIRAIRYATLLGAIWTNLVMLNVLKEFSASTQFAGVPIFSARWDHSGMSICIGILLWGSFPKAELKESQIIRFFLLFSILLQYSRASYVGLFFVLLSIYFVDKARRKIKSNNKSQFLTSFLIFAILGLPAFFLFAPIFPENSALNRIGISNILSPSKLINETKDSGTTRARIDAQRVLNEWVHQNNLQFFGAGPGREMLLESKAFTYLSGALDVRSPHSWFYGNFARFGYLGLIYWHAICLLYLKSQNLAVRIFDVPINILFAIYIIAAFGVIMESPFGILPFSFFLGGGKIFDLAKV